MPSRAVIRVPEDVQRRHGTRYTHVMSDHEKALGVRARELYPAVTNLVFVYGQTDDPSYPWQPVDPRLSQYGVTGADLVDGTLFLRVQRQQTWQRRLWIGWTWFRRGLWWR